MTGLTKKDVLWLLDAMEMSRKENFRAITDGLSESIIKKIENSHTHGFECYLNGNRYQMYTKGTVENGILYVSCYALKNSCRAEFNKTIKELRSLLQ